MEMRLEKIGNKLIVVDCGEERNKERSIEVH
jgi:hypothetical protein